MCVETIGTVLIFPRAIDLRGHMPRFTLKMNIFPSISSKNPINVCWNPQNRDHFSKTTNLRGHMPRFTLKMNIFPSISWETPEMCVGTLRTGIVFPRQSIWGVTCLSLVGKWMFSHLCPWKHHKCVLKPSEQCSFFWVDSIWGVTCLGLL